MRQFQCLVCDSIVPTDATSDCQCGALSVYVEHDEVRIIGDVLLYQEVEEVC
jgi:hypothetical protein